MVGGLSVLAAVGIVIGGVDRGATMRTTRRSRVATTHFLGEPMPDLDALELGAEHEEHAVECGGVQATVRTSDGGVHRNSRPWAYTSAAPVSGRVVRVCQ